MATQVQRRRGTTAEHATFTGAEGELTIDTTKKTVVVHDGATLGGFPVASTIGNNSFSGTAEFTNSISVKAASGTYNKVALVPVATSGSNWTANIAPYDQLTANRQATLPNATGYFALTTDTTGLIVNSSVSPTAAIAGSKISPNFGTQTIQCSDITSRRAALNDAVEIFGRSGGTGGFSAILTPAALTSTVTLTLPAVTGTLASLAGTQTFTGLKTFSGTSTLFYNTTATQDGIVLAGRAGGTGSFRSTLIPGTLTANRTLTLPDVTGTIVTSGDTGTVTSTMIADGTIVDGDINATAAIAGSKVSPAFGNQSITSSATVGLDLTGTPNATATSNGVLSVGTLGFAGTGIGADLSATVDSYYQSLIQNKSADPAASADFVVCNDQSSDSAFYGNFGMNSSTFSGAGPFGQPNNVYLTATSSDLCLGTTTNNALRFCVNSETFDQARIDVDAIYLRKPLRLFDADASAYVAFASPTAVAANVTWTLPGAQGNFGEAMISDGAGNLVFSDVQQIIAKPASTTRNATTALSADPNLQFPMSAGGTYNFKMAVFFTTSAAGDFKYGYTGPAGATTIIVKAVSMAPGAAAYTVSTIATAYNTAGIAITSNNAGIGFVELEGLIVNGATAGNFQFTWAQNTSDATGPTLVYGGSYLKYDRASS